MILTCKDHNSTSAVWISMDPTTRMLFEDSLNRIPEDFYREARNTHPRPWETETTGLHAIGIAQKHTTVDLESTYPVRICGIPPPGLGFHLESYKVAKEKTTISSKSSVGKSPPSQSLNVYVNRDQRHRLAISQPTYQGDRFFQFHAIYIGRRCHTLRSAGVSPEDPANWPYIQG
ncbi:hypothetical protein PG993_011678 [Apiospora rasikravindrae]|uniref:Uncharacterized protein n=1 Tax=Apiospora rasikravindrae TaxID=990691 RepID=A0ABR1S0B0_9PEZI